MTSAVDRAERFHQFPLKIKAARHGVMMYLETDKYIGQSFDLYGEYCEGEIEIFRQVVLPGATVIDAGANIGAHTVWLAKTVGPQGSVHAFEPQTHIHNILCANLALNGIQNACTYQCCVGGEEGRANIPVLNYEQPDNYGGVYVDAPVTDVFYKVPVRTIDSLGLTRCDFIKIDVEGMETEAIAGASRTIETCEPVLYVENDRPEHSETLINLIRSFGYRLFEHHAFYFSPDNYFAEPRNVYGAEQSRSLICMPGRFDYVEMQGFTAI